MKKIFVAAVAALALCACGSKQAQTVETEEVEQAAAQVEYIRLNVPIHVEAAKAEATIDLAKQLIEASLKDNGVMEYDMFKSLTRPDFLLIYETWKDQPSLDAHSAADHFTTLVPKIQEQGEMAIDQFVKMVDQEMEGETIRVNCHIVPNDPAQKEAVLKLAKELTEATQKDAGMVEYDLLESVTRPNELMIYETWKDMASMEAHCQQEHFTRLFPQIREIAKVNGERFHK